MTVTKFINDLATHMVFIAAMTYIACAMQWQPAFLVVPVYVIIVSVATISEVIERRRRKQCRNDGIRIVNENEE